MKTIFTHAYIEFDDFIDRDEEFVDYGAINLACEGREYAIDVVQSYWYREDGEEQVHTPSEVKCVEAKEGGVSVSGVECGELSSEVK